MCQWVPPLKKPQKKIRGRFGERGGLVFIFFCNGLGAAQVGECTVLCAGCRPLGQNSSAAGTAGVQAVGWGLKQGG